MKHFLPIILSATILAFSCNVERVEEKPQIPILAWFSIPAGEQSTVERYQELKDAGFTHTLTFCGSVEDATHILDICQEVGLKSFFGCPQMETKTDSVVGLVKDHPALGAYFLRDEPTNEQMQGLGEWARKVEAVDTLHPCYLNLLPRPAFGSDESYVEHLRQFSEKVALPQISFDHYPIKMFADTLWLCPQFYSNLEMVSAEAKRTGKPFWAFALATTHWDYPMPNIGHLRLQLYADLAYGAQLLQYFTYWNPGAEDPFHYREAPINLAGRRSPAFELVREMNAELQKRADIFLGCEVESVYHVGDSIPEGTTALSALPVHFQKLDTQGKGALVSTLKNNGRRYVVLQNTSLKHSLELQIETDGKLLLCRRDGSRVPASKYGPLFVLTVGDVLIFECADETTN